MIDNLIDMFGTLIESSKQRAKANPSPIKNKSTWKHCVVLTAAGWKAVSYRRSEEDFCNDVIITWKKEGKDDLEMTLPLDQQCMWIDYLERKNKEKK